MSIGVIGGTGFIGSATVRRLLALGEHPVVIARGAHPVALPDGATLAPADRMDSAALLEIFHRYDVDTVIDIFALGLGNTTPVFDAVRAVGGHYVLLSSIDVYSNYAGLLRRETPPIQSRPAREDDPLRTMRYPYRDNSRRPRGVEDTLFDDYDKIVLEEAALAEPAFTATVVRAPMVFGPGDKQHRFAWAIEAVSKGGTIGVDERAAGWGNSFAYVEDIGEALALAATHPAARGRIYNAGQGFVRTPVEWLQTFADLLEQKVEVTPVPPDRQGLLWDRAEASDLRYPLTLDTGRIRAELGFRETVSEREALLATIADEARHASV